MGAGKGERERAKQRTQHQHQQLFVVAQCSVKRNDFVHRLDSVYSHLEFVYLFTFLRLKLDHSIV